ncbi:MAG: hypothetical protein Q7S23_02250 [bacterium]|nr:hypothetical protein [bacterium]
MAGSPFLRRQSSSWLKVAAWVGFGSALFIVRWYLNPDDDGFTLTAAWQVSNGLLPYRDFFEFHPPGAFYLFGGLFRAVGPSYEAARLLLFAVSLPGAYAFNRLSALFAERSWQRAAVLASWLMLVWQFSAISYHAVAHLASVGAILALVLAWRHHAGTPAPLPRQIVRDFALAGLTAGATGMVLQTAGVLISLAGVVTAVATRQVRALAAYAIGAGVMLLPLIFWPPAMLWRQLVAIPLARYPGANLSYDHPTWLIGAMVVTAAIGVLAWFLRVRSAGFWPLWLVALILPLSVWPHSSVGYLASVVWPLPLLLLAVNPSGWRRPLSFPLRHWLIAAWQAALGIWGTAMLALAVLSVGAFAFRFPYHDPLALRVPFWEDLAALVRQRTAPGEPIFALPHLTALYFYAQRPNATRHNSLQTEFHPAEFQNEIIADLERSQPRLVVREAGGRLARIGQYREGNIVDRYLDARYRLVDELQQFAPRRIQLWERRPSSL